MRKSKHKIIFVLAIIILLVNMVLFLFGTKREDPVEFDNSDQIIIEKIDTVVINKMIDQ